MLYAAMRTVPGFRAGAFCSPKRCEAGVCFADDFFASLPASCATPPSTTAAKTQPPTLAIVLSCLNIVDSSEIGRQCSTVDRPHGCQVMRVVTVGEASAVV
jgi:hypothetical protein